MNVFVSLLLMLIGMSAFAADAARDRLDQVQAAIGRVQQEQQAAYQQFQMVQTLLRDEEERPLRSYTPPAPRDYEEVQREEEARKARIRQYREELPRLYARYRALEAERTELAQRHSELLQEMREAGKGRRFAFGLTRLARSSGLAAAVAYRSRMRPARGRASR